MSTINFGIDLGTTNSLIARASGGRVEVFKNPSGHKETLPSAVAYRKGKTIVGDKAREYVEKDPSNVFAGFKRKMGTDERFFVPEIMDFKSPIDLSALVLQELRQFIHSGEQPDAAVITIPASFDTIQSNATKEAGYLAGFKEVVLLQEPVAASLAFANGRADDAPELSGQWLVYDLGGGTFDVALVKFTVDGEMRVADHEGDNFLGGLDFDGAIIEKIIVPQLEASGKYPGIAEGLRSAGGGYQKLYYTLLHKAEEAKIALSHSGETEIEFELEDEDVTVMITRAQFEACVQPQIDYSITLVQRLLEKNSLGAKDIEEIILIGGSTFIPLVRQLLEQRLGIKVNTAADPTTAVAVGAAHFAATRKRQQTSSQPANQLINQSTNQLTARTAYARNSREREEYFTAAFEGASLDGLQYRMLRADGGWDSGLKPLSARVSEMLPLLPSVSNSFRLSVFDKAGNAVPADIPAIEIVQGQFSIQGQPLPADICLEVDDPVNKTTRLEVIFEKNNILPLRKTVVREVARMIRMGSDDALIINVLEGSRYAAPASNLPIGVIEIRGTGLSTDLIKGSDVEIMLEINESRDLKIAATLLMNEQEYANLFTPTVRQVSIERLRGELKDLLWDARQLMNKAEQAEHYEEAARLQRIVESLESTYSRASKMSSDDITDEKYSLDERKRSLARELDVLGKDANLNGVVDEYLEERDWARSLLANDAARLERLDRIVADERSYLASQSIYLLKSKIQEMRRLTWDVRKNDPVMLISSFHYCDALPDEKFTDPKRARQYLEQSDKAIERQNYSELLAALSVVWALVIEDGKRDSFSGTGLG